MIAELRKDNEVLTKNMREVHSLCDDAGDVATASLLENWIDETEKRIWFLFECGQHAGTDSRDFRPGKGRFARRRSDAFAHSAFRPAPQELPGRIRTCHEGR